MGLDRHLQNVPIHYLLATALPLPESGKFYPERKEKRPSMAPILSDSRAVEILKHHCDPKIYPTEEEMLRGLADAVDREIIVLLRAFLGKVIDDDSLPAPQKVKKYFGLSISNEEKAEIFIDEIYCSISEYLFADEE